jgi:hypothetical protein
MANVSSERGRATVLVYSRGPQTLRVGADAVGRRPSARARIDWLEARPDVRYGWPWRAGSGSRILDGEAQPTGGECGLSRQFNYEIQRMPADHRPVARKQRRLAVSKWSLAMADHLTADRPIVAAATVADSVAAGSAEILSCADIR